LNIRRKSAPQKQLDKVSKFLSFVLRHKPSAISLKLDDQGWAEVSELIDKASSEMPLTAELIKQVVVTNEKHRFSLSEDSRRIRANQGHSIKVDLDLTPMAPPTILYHGTATRFLSSILKEGLRSGQRHHVHLSTDIETATSVGQRYGKPLVLQVSSGEMYQQRFIFFVSENGVWLTESVPVNFLSVLE
jgi:putative RNA 2'-phosphotransferase